MYCVTPSCSPYTRMPDPENKAAVEPASTKARIITAVLLVIMGIAVFFAERLFDTAGAWIAEDPEKALERFNIFIILVAAMSVPLLVVGILSIHNGARTLATNRFPPPGMWVLVDTPIESGAKARRQGRLFQVGGILLCVIAVGFPIALWSIVHSIASG